MLIVRPDGTVQLTRGDTAELEVSITKDNSEEYTIQETDELTFSVKKSVFEKSCVIHKTVKGTSTIRIDPEDTSALDFCSYQYDVQLTTASGDVYTVIPPSTFEIMPEVTCANAT